MVSTTKSSDEIVPAASPVPVGQFTSMSSTIYRQFQYRPENRFRPPENEEGFNTPRSSDLNPPRPLHPLRLTRLRGPCLWHPCRGSHSCHWPVSTPCQI